MPYDPIRAEVVIRFFEEYLVYVDGPLVGQPIKLRDWQADPIRQAFGTIGDDGLREIQTMFWCMNKKQGKTEVIAAGLALYMLTMGAEAGANVYCLANSRDQAAQVFKPAASMVRMSEPLQSLGLDPATDILESSKTIIYRPLNSTLKAWPAEAGALHGKKPSFLVVDEIHAMRNRLLIDALREGMGTWSEPLTLYITNMGEIGGSTVFWEEKEYADKALADPEFDPAYLPVIYEAPAGMSDDELLEEGPHWYELCPGLGDFQSLTDMRRACREAKEKPAQRQNVLRFRLGRATQPTTAWINVARWRACKVEFDEQDLAARECYAGLDLSSKWDFSSTSLIFPEPDGGATILPFGYVPEGNIDEIEKITGKPIRRWVELKLLLATPGDRIDLDFIENHIEDLSKTFTIRQLAFDPQWAEQITQHVEAFGIERVEFPQTTVYYNEPCQEFEAQISTKKIRHNGHPVLDYCVESAAIKVDERERIKPVKIRERRTDSRRIDLLVSSLMGFAMRIREDTSESVYESRGLLDV